MSLRKPRTPILQDSPMAAGLVGAWIVDEGGGTTIRNLVTKNDATITSPAISSKSSRGPVVYYDGTTGYTDCGTGAELNVTSALTVSAWVQIFAQVAYAGIAGENYGSDNSGYIMLHDYASSNKFGGWIGISGTAYRAEGITTANLLEWYHVVLRYDGAEVRTYVNGVFEDGLSPAATGDITYPTATNFNIGRYQSASDFEWNGLIDNVYVWNRALSDGEIFRLYTMPWILVKSRDLYMVSGPEAGGIGTPALSAPLYRRRRVG